MAVIKESDLPGVGKKYILEETGSGDRIAILLHIDGRLEIYFYEKCCEDPTSVIKLNEEEARKVGAILGGVFFKPTPTKDLEAQLRGLLIEWYELTKAMPCIKKSIGELEIRKKTGVSIIAILRGDAALPSPGPDTVLKDRDTLVAIGTREQHSKFKKAVLGEE